MMSLVPVIFSELLGLLACSVEMTASSEVPGALLHVVQLVLFCPPLGDLPDPGIESGSPALQVGSLPTEPPGKPYFRLFPGHGPDLFRVPTTETGVLLVIAVPLDSVHLVEFSRRIRTVPLGLFKATTGV